jgi:hypothetical protein
MRVSFFEDVLAIVDLVPAAVDDGDGKPVAVFEYHHDGHGEEAVDLPGDGRELAARVVGAFQLDGDEDVRLEQAALHRIIGEEGGFAAKFLVGELKEKVGGLPLGNEGFGVVKGVTGGEVIKEVLRLGACADEELVALVAELGEELAGGVLERESLEIGEGGLHGALMTSQVTSSRSVFSWTCSFASGRTKPRPDWRPEAARLRNVAARESTAFCRSVS